MVGVIGLSAVEATGKFAVGAKNGLLLRSMQLAGFEFRRDGRSTQILQELGKPFDIDEAVCYFTDGGSAVRTSPGVAFKMSLKAGIAEDFGALGAEARIMGLCVADKTFHIFHVEVISLG